MFKRNRNAVRRDSGLRTDGGSARGNRERESQTRGRTAAPEDAGQSSEATEKAGQSSEATENGQSTDVRPVEIGEVFDVLQDRRRRNVLWHLSTVSEQVSIGDLAESIAAWECEKPVDQLTSQEQKRVYIALYQGHLPKMAAAGAVRYDQDGGTVERGPHFERFIDHLPAEDKPVSDEEEGDASLLGRLSGFFE